MIASAIFLFCPIVGRNGLFQLKGRPVVDQEMLDLLRHVGLTEKKMARPCSLSGGQKRKLSLAIALVGGSEVSAYLP